MNLLNYSWYRSLYTKRTFVKADGQWMDKRDYKTGKVTDVDGVWSSQAFCECGNELIHSGSRVTERDLVTHSVIDYVCTHCGQTQHWNPDIIPGLIECDKNGTPI